MESPVTIKGKLLEDGNSYVLRVKRAIKESNDLEVGQQYKFQVLEEA